MVTADKSFQLFGCKYISGQLKKLCSEMDGARIEKEVESVHQSRVASRRLRTAFEVFASCFPDKSVKKWSSEVKKLTKGLGAARDADVQVMHLKEILSGLDVEQRSFKPGIERMILRAGQHRGNLQRGVVKTIDRLESRTVLADIHSTVERTMFCLRNESREYKSDYVFRTCKKHIVSNLDSMRSYESSLIDSSDRPSHHQMRIEAKKLRYTLEICSEPYDGGLEESLKTVKKIQSLLGDIHDCDVWAEYIDGFMGEELERTRAYFGNEVPYYLLLPGLEYIRQLHENKRNAIFEQLCDYWADLQEAKVWDELLAVLNKRLENTITAKPEIIEIQDTKETPPNGQNTQISLALRGYSREFSGDEGGNQ